jgi:hypothetical protein
MVNVLKAIPLGRLGGFGCDRPAGRKLGRAQTNPYVYFSGSADASAGA